MYRTTAGTGMPPTELTVVFPSFCAIERRQVPDLVADLVLLEDQALEVLRDAALEVTGALMSTPAHFVFGYFFAIVWIDCSIRKPTPMTRFALYFSTHVWKFGM